MRGKQDVRLPNSVEATRRAGLLRAAVVLGVVGFAVNDSGLVVPAFVLLPLLPVLAAAGRRPEA